MLYLCDSLPLQASQGKWSWGCWGLNFPRAMHMKETTRAVMTLGIIQLSAEWACDTENAD